jgi:hypothetical protein
MYPGYPWWRVVAPTIGLEPYGLTMRRRRLLLSLPYMASAIFGGVALWRENGPRFGSALLLLSVAGGLGTAYFIWRRARRRMPKPPTGS